jgi:predicted nucleic acid-binding protein
MKFLLDTNIWLEVLLNQEKSGEVIELFRKYNGNDIAISDFSLHSIGVILARLKEIETFNIFLEDLINSGVKVISLKTEEIIKKYNLDFDDAYQYLIAKQNNLILVSFDKDFDKTDILRKIPRDLV